MTHKIKVLRKYPDGNMVYDMARCPLYNHLYFEDEAAWKQPYCMQFGGKLEW